MKKPELIQRCKELGIKNISSKNKDELMFLIKEYEEKLIKHCPSAIGEFKHRYSSTMAELMTTYQKDKLRQQNNIKRYIMSLHCLCSKTTEELCEETGEIFNISANSCKILYKEIDPVEWLNRNMDIENYISIIKSSSQNCFECGKCILQVQDNTQRIWKKNKICDSCWSDHSLERDCLWEQIKDYKLVQCVICNSIQTKKHERFNYDHVNMFNKNFSICLMVNNGCDIEDIYSEIDKCQIVCLSCHHIITEIEHKLGFTRMKQLLTRKINSGEISNDEYEATIMVYQELYKKKMDEVYHKLKMSI